MERHRLPVSSSAGDRFERLSSLVYELLDAHADTRGLARPNEADPRWRVHLGYLRDLQRVAREVLADVG